MKWLKRTQISIFFTIMILLSIMCSNTINADQQALMTINDVKLSIGKNDSTFLIMSEVMDVVGSCSVTLSWDPDVGSVVDVIDGDFCELYYYADDVNGSLSFIGFSTDGLSGDFVIAEIVFEAVGKVGDSCDLIIEESELLDADEIEPDEINHSSVGGKITIEAQNNNGGSAGGGSNGNGGLPSDQNYVIANALLSETIGFVGLNLLFDGSQSTPEGSIISYDWDFDDGETGTGITIYHSFSTAGIYHVTLTVTDNQGKTDIDTINVTILQSGNYPPSKPVLIGPDTGQKNNVYEFTVLSSDADNDTIRYYVDWGDGNTFTTSFVSQNTSITINHSWIQSGRYMIMVTADDNNTLSESTTHVFLSDAEELYYGELYIGFITDENNDGTFDTFDHKHECIMYSDEMQLYLIDHDVNGIWDFTYDVETKVVASYEDSSENSKKTNNNTEENSVLLYGLLFIIILGVIFLLFYRKRLK